MPAQTRETVLYGFQGGSDGESPDAGLTNVNGVFYGTTLAGGAKHDGTVFKVTASGAETVIHSFETGFGAGNDGGIPAGGLANVNGVLYGTTEWGGATGNGTVFEITTSGAETVLYSFAGGSDGAHPAAGLVGVNGVLYGTTNGGGTGSRGTVFRITTSGAETVLHSFGSDGTPGFGAMTDVDGLLYGTTYIGGATACGCGNVFKITTSGEESVLYDFKGGSDGANPYKGLTEVNGALYGTTYEGGASNRGTVFKVTTSGKESVLYSFKGGSDGANPESRLVKIGDAFYGTTSSGGGCSDKGCGTAFKITESSAETVIHRFGEGNDGAGPAAGLTDVNGVLYGTTIGGGPSHDGTVFALSL